LTKSEPILNGTDGALRAPNCNFIYRTILSNFSASQEVTTRQVVRPSLRSAL